VNSLAARFLLFGVVFLVCSDTSNANYCPAYTLVVLRSHVLSGKATSHSRPETGALLTLYRAASELELVGNMDVNDIQRRKLAETRTDDNGLFRFGSLVAGRYMIISRTTTIHIVLITPKNGENDVVEIEDYDDCDFSNVVNAEGKRITGISSGFSVPWSEVRY
jgi:hypothetical protein